MGSIPLGQRGVHVHFLKRLAVERVPGGSGCFGELLTEEVVKHFIKPSTAPVRSSYAEALLAGQVPPKYQLPWCTSGTIRDIDGGVQQVFGATRYFASHAWGCRFSSLVGLLEAHYAALQATKDGIKFLPVYYWVDIFAVTQHFTGDFKDHPDSDFRGVIRNSKAVLFTMVPWRAPVAPTRVWCLFEALTAIQAPGVGFEVVLDVKDSKDTRVKTITVISGSIDVRTAQATVMSDKAYILGCIEQGIGVNSFNGAIRRRLKEALLQAITPKAVEMGDTAALQELIKIGGCVRPDGIADLASCFRAATEGDMIHALRSMQLRDLRPRGLVLSGKQRTKEVTLSDGGLRGWDGESFSLREYGELDTGRIMWPYLPASPALCQAMAELMVMPSPTVSGGAGINSSGGRGIEELWISLRAPRADDLNNNSSNSSVLVVASKNSPAASTMGSEPGTPHDLGTPREHGVLRETYSPRSSRSDTRGVPGAGVGRSVSALSGLGAPGSATAARAVARAAIASPSRHRLQASHSIGHTSGLAPSRPSSGAPSPRQVLSPQTSINASPALRASSQHALSSGRFAGLGQGQERPALPALSASGGGSGGPSPRVSLGGQPVPGLFASSLILGVGGGYGAGVSGAGSSGGGGSTCPSPRASLSGHGTAPPGMATLMLAGGSTGVSPRMQPTPPPAGGAASVLLAGGSNGPSPRVTYNGAPQGVLSSLVLGGGSTGGSPRVSLSGLPGQQGYASTLRSPRNRCGGAGSVPGNGLEDLASLLQLADVAVDLPPGRPALWVAVGASQTLRMLCLHQAVLVPQDVQSLSDALETCETLQILQFVKCVAPGAEASGVHATARLTAELLALGLSCGTLRQLHVRPADPVYIEAMPACTPRSDSELRRVSLTPVALSPAAIRSLGRSLAVLSEMHSLVVGLDPAPYASWMPKETHERDHWLAYEDKVEPEMAARRRKHMGMDEEGAAAFIANAWDLKEELSTLPSPGRSSVATLQRAAGISFCLAVVCGWRDLAAYKRTYARWAWARKHQPEDTLAEMVKNLEMCKELVAEMLQAVPEPFAVKFTQARQSQRAKSRLQEAYWELYG